ncbi:DUF5060 domain-containing protein [Paenibacillus rhizoplanae]
MYCKEVLPGGNPFTEVALQAEFSMGERSVLVLGFYDGDGVYRIRFMPEHQGKWTFRTSSNEPALHELEGELECTAAAVGNHGPVRVRNTFHFAYADGTPYLPVGTTCYAWTHQGDEMERQTLDTLKACSF